MKRKIRGVVTAILVMSAVGCSSEEKTQVTNEAKSTYSSEKDSNTQSTKETQSKKTTDEQNETTEDVSEAETTTDIVQSEEKETETKVRLPEQTVSTNNVNTGNSQNNTNNISANKNNNTSSNTNGSISSNTNNSTPSYDYGNVYTEQEKNMGQAVVNKIITPGMSEFDKAKAIHDYMVINIDYDYDNYYAGTLSQASYNVTGALQNKYAVCSGYAKTFKLLCDLTGLECEIVTGTAGLPHAWNQVKINGNWYNVDVTWDDPVSSGKNFNDHSSNRYSYFLVSDEILYKDHKADDAKHVCNSSLMMQAYEAGAPWMKDEFVYIKSEAELRKLVEEKIESGSTNIDIMCDANVFGKHNELKETLKGMLQENLVVGTVYMGGYKYSNIENTSLYWAKYVVKTKNGMYEKADMLMTVDDIKEVVLKLNGSDKYEMMVAMINEIAITQNYDKVIEWALNEYNIEVHFTETTVVVSSRAKAISVYINKSAQYSTGN